MPEPDENYATPEVIGILRGYFEQSFSAAQRWLFTSYGASLVGLSAVIAGNTHADSKITVGLLETSVSLIFLILVSISIAWISSIFTVSFLARGYYIAAIFSGALISDFKVPRDIAYATLFCPSIFSLPQGKTSRLLTVALPSVFVCATIILGSHSWHLGWMTTLSCVVGAALPAVVVIFVAYDAPGRALASLAGAPEAPDWN